MTKSQEELILELEFFKKSNAQLEERNLSQFNRIRSLEDARASIGLKLNELSYYIENFKLLLDNPYSSKGKNESS